MEKDLTYDTAYSLVLSIEAAEKDTKHLRAGSDNPQQHILYNCRVRVKEAEVQPTF